MLTITGPPLSRTPSTNTITQSRALGQQLSARHQVSQHRQKPEQDRVNQETTNTNTVDGSRSSINSPSLHARSSSSSSSSPSDSDDGNPAKRSQLFKRPPRFQSHRHKRDYEDVEEEEEEVDDHHGLSTGGPALPFAKPSETTNFSNTSEFSKTGIPSSSRPGRPSRASGKVEDANTERKRVPVTSGIEASSSLASSTSDAPMAGLTSPGPLSPQHRASLLQSSPRGAGQRAGKEGSEGTPSMGSSFSDIDGTR
jgi:hypothetical protein